GFFDSGDKKKKKKKEGVSSTPSDEFPVLSGIAKNVKNIKGKTNVPKSILKKAVRNIVNNTHEVVKPSHDGGSASKVSFEVVGASAKSSTKVDDATNFSPKLGCSFANLLKPNDTTNKIHFRTLVNDERIESVDCVLPKDAAAKYVSNTWRKFGFERITRNDDGVYLFKFATKSGRDQVIDKGPWMIRKSPIMLSKWSPSVSLKKGEVTKVLVCVKMYNIPVFTYSEDGLSLLATQIGKPIMLDAFTSSMCVESWGRISFAQDLIEIDAAVGLKNEVSMAIPVEEGNGHIKEVIRVEYEWMPPHCVDCIRFGHDTSLCPKQDLTAKDAAAKVKSRKFGFERITRNDDGVYLFKFATKSGRDQVIDKGPWMIRKSPIMLSKWSPSVSLKKGEVTKVLVCVKMYNIPVFTYSEDGLSLLATQIGKPIMLDAFTSSMCVESWGRISFAQDLIEIDAAVGLKNEVSMAIPVEEGNGHIKEVSDHVNSVLNKIKDASKPSSSNSGYGDGNKDMNVRSPL
nr:hypothetical protein [Tanacetum cinerariifolium]